jgi:hypothetical protein
MERKESTSLNGIVRLLKYEIGVPFKTLIRHQKEIMERYQVCLVTCGVHDLVLVHETMCTCRSDNSRADESRYQRYTYTHRIQVVDKSIQNMYNKYNSHFVT